MSTETTANHKFQPSENGFRCALCGESLEHSNHARATISNRVYATSLADAKEGEYLMHVSRDRKTPTMVQRCTAATLFCFGNIQYWRKNGDRKGVSTWDTDCLRVTNAEEVAEVRAHNTRQHLSRQLSSVNAHRWAKLSVEQLEQVKAVLTASGHVFE